MRKLYSIFAVLVICGMVMVGTAQAQGFRSSPGTGDILGQKKYQSDAHKIFRMVRYIPPTFLGSTTLAADSIVVWSLTADDGVTVTTTTTSSDSAVAGIIVQEAQTPEVDGNTAVQDRGKRNWTWLQTYGLSQTDLVTGGGSTVAGDAFSTSTTAGEVVQHVGTLTLDARAQGIAGFFYDVSAAGDNNVQVFIMGLD